MLKRLFFLFLILLTCNLKVFCQVKNVPTVKLQEKEYYKYEVKSKETIYALCRRFNITEAELLAANPTIVEGLKNGQMLLIPLKEDKTKDTAIRSQKGAEKQKNTLYFSTDKPRISLLLPFASNNTPSLNERYIEFYEGFLLAVDSLKSLGLSFEVQALECGHDTEAISKLIESGKLDETDYCIGGVNAEQISLLSEWAKKNQRYLIFPFSSKIQEMANNPYLFQTNTPHLYMFNRLADYASQRVVGTNIVFLKSTVDESDIRSQLIPIVKTKFKKLGIPFQEVEVDEDLEALSKVLSDKMLNQIVPTPLSMQETNNLLTKLSIFQNIHPNIPIALIGYPDWMAINKTYKRYLFELNTVIYSNFYADIQQKNVRDFQILFNQTYDHNLLNMYPKYGMMGYDVARFFIPRMVFEKSEVNDAVPYISPLQNDFKFGTSKPLSGASNQSFYIIHYTPENEVDVKVMN